jgi:hypothetical protein
MFDRNNPVMKPDSLYPSMKEFYLAMRQYSIDKEFELRIDAGDNTPHAVAFARTSCLRALLCARMPGGRGGGQRDLEGRRVPPLPAPGEPHKPLPCSRDKWTSADPDAMEKGS